MPPEGIAARFADSDVIVAADGVNSRIREHFRESFRAGSRDQVEPLLLDGLDAGRWTSSTTSSGETEHGIICAHTYQYEAGRSTWIFEMDDACWRGHGFDAHGRGSVEGVAGALYAEELQGHALLLNRSNWRQFPRIFCQ